MDRPRVNPADSLRAFLALELPPQVRREAARLRDQLRAAGVHASWVRTENIHITLRFLGNVSPAVLGYVSDTLAEQLAAPLDLRLALAGAGAFPNLRRPSVIWAGVRVLAGDLASLAAIAENSARAVGLPPENRPFHPHATLGRIKDPRNAHPLAELLPDFADIPLGDAFDLRAVTLFKSELRPAGAQYTPLREFPLR